MCGIATISIGRRSRGRIPYHKLQDLVSELLVELEARGRDASGIAIINEGETPSVVFKKPLRSSRLVVRPLFKEVLKNINTDTNFIMLHTRASTSGNNTENHNNHPILIPNFVGIHNGTLWNDDSLFKRHEKDFSRIGEVDSEAIFQLYSHYLSTGLESENAIKKTTGELQGAFTGAVVDLRNPHRMVMFRYERTLCFLTIPHFDILVTISEAKFFKQAVETLKIKAQVGRCEFIHDGVGLIVDLNSENRITDKLHDFRLPVPDTSRWRSQSAWVQTNKGV